MSRTLVSSFAYLLVETVARAQLSSGIDLNFLEPDILTFRSVAFLQQTSLRQMVGELDSYHQLHLRWLDKHTDKWTNIKYEGTTRYPWDIAI